MPRFLVSLAVLAFFSVATPPVFAQDAYENLHVLPKDISQDELSASMLDNLWSRVWDGRSRCVRRCRDARGAQC